MPKVCIIRQKNQTDLLGQLGSEGKKEADCNNNPLLTYHPSPFIHCPTFSIFVKHCQKISSVSGGHLIQWKCSLAKGAAGVLNSEMPHTLCISYMGISLFFFP
jgi:hypothetical protein